MQHHTDKWRSGIDVDEERQRLEFKKSVKEKKEA